MQYRLSLSSRSIRRILTSQVRKKADVLLSVNIAATRSPNMLERKDSMSPLEYMEVENKRV